MPGCDSTSSAAQPAAAHTGLPFSVLVAQTTSARGRERASSTAITSRAAGDRRQRKAAAHRLAVAREVGHDAVLLLRAAPRDAKAGDDLVEDEHDAVAARDLAHRLEKAGLRQQHALQRLDDHRRELVRVASIIATACAVSLNGATSTVSPACGGTPTESGCARG